MTTELNPLQGIRVLDFTFMMAGPYCTRYLADLGADVIKIETAEGDYMRTREPLREGHSAYFGHLNCGKRSVVLDLKSPIGLEAARQLALRSDVLVENFRPGVMQRLGLDFATLCEANPKLVYCSISGFGQTGPSATRAAYAQIVSAASGYDLAFAGYQDVPPGADHRPPNNALFLADVLGGTYAFSGILAALNQRHTTGRGQHVDATLMECMLNLMPYEVQEAQFPIAKRRPVYPPLRTLDGYMMVAAVSPKNFEMLFDAIGLTGWRTDPVLGTDTERQAHWHEVMSRIEHWTSQRGTAVCEQVFSDAGLPATGYKSVAEALDDPQTAHRGSLARVRLGSLEHRVPNLPFKLSAARVEARPDTPELGQHTEEVLGGLLHMDAASIGMATGGATKSAS
ncbi:MAG: CoA transferase [Sulfuricaulis sp.]|nr:CoA transferase [Sulfuricaulis sp.]